MKYNFRLSICVLLITVVVAVSFTAPPQQTEKGLLQQFIELSENPATAERQASFERLPGETKAQLHRLNLALAFMSRRDLSQDQKRLLLTAISRLDASRYDGAAPAELSPSKIGLDKQITGLFSPEDQARIFQTIGVSDANLIAGMKNNLIISTIASEQERRVHLAGESADTRKAFWRVKAAVHLASERFTDEQYELFVEFADVLHSESMYAKPANKEFQARLDTLAHRSFKVFLKEDANRIFMSPGGEKNCKPGAVSTSDGDASRLPPPCNCYYAASCGFISTCGGRCSASPGCGIGGGTDCDGVCGSI